jgi:hypothetical protein
VVTANTTYAAKISHQKTGGKPSPANKSTAWYEYVKVTGTVSKFHFNLLKPSGFFTYNQV